MKRPPMFVALSINPGKGDEEGGFTLWIPLFIIVPIVFIILLAIFLVVLPVLIIAFLFTWEAYWWRWAAFSVAAFFRTLHELPGLKVDIQDGRQKIFIDVT